MSQLKVDTITSRDGSESTDVTNVINGSAKAWVEYNGTSNVIRESFNVTSVTDVATGKFTVNFTNAFVDDDYAVCGSSSVTSSYSSYDANFSIGDEDGTYGVKTTSACGIHTCGSSNTLADARHICAIFFR